MGKDTTKYTWIQLKLFYVMSPVTFKNFPIYALLRNKEKLFKKLFYIILLYHC